MRGDSMKGIGAVIHELGGGSEKSASNYAGRKIINANHEGEVFNIDFEDGTKIQITDDGQSCCESRYLTCDDNPKDLIGQTLQGITVKFSETEDNYEIHEIAFLEIQGDKSSVTFATHNEHNGYYGGFGLNIREL